MDIFSWWTFTDVFEEQWLTGVPFQNGFGLLTTQVCVCACVCVCMYVCMVWYGMVWYVCMYACVCVRERGGFALCVWLPECVFGITYSLMHLRILSKVIKPHYLNTHSDSNDAQSCIHPGCCQTRLPRLPAAEQCRRYPFGGMSYMVACV